MHSTNICIGDMQKSALYWIEKNLSARSCSLRHLHVRDLNLPNPREVALKASVMASFLYCHISK